ncbi:class I SAM-dependent methyltransferase [Phenylobacterium sp.]|uniref:class I SAM-dependent methyltransferase n=1 Tax=Phenylobacterium sp. TaxID=1871053 RepID=UPI00286A3D2A|nr:class I SAM-dependent methyltransferase [Phenylobacterium sp.]
MLKFLFKPWPKHPIDRLYRIETSARVIHRSLRVGNRALDEANVGYGCSQPSVLRSAFGALPGGGADAHLFDLGCGKGRALALATEFPFRSITGIELAPGLCRIARRNAATIARRHPDRVPLKIVEGDATKPDLPSSGDQILFLYNSFRRPLVNALLTHVEAHGAAHPDARIFLVYYNPTQAAALDGSPRWRRYFADQIGFSDEDARYAPFANRSDSVVIWQLDSPKRAPPHPGAERAIEIVIPDIAAIVLERYLQQRAGVRLHVSSAA